MNREEAFAQLIEQRNWYEGLKISPNTAATHKKRFKEGKIVSLDFMGRALKAAGYEINIQEDWHKNI